MKRWSFFFLFTSWLVSSLAIIAHAEEIQAKAEALVRSLGSSEFEEREKASKALVELGHQAKAALERGLQDQDVEIRRRCRDLLPRALERDLEVRLEAFLNNKEVVTPIPGWTRFAKIVGIDSDSKKFFVNMVRDDSGLLALSEADPKRLQEQLFARLLQIHNGVFPQDGSVRRYPRVSEVITLFFIASDERLKDDFQHTAYFQTLMTQPEFVSLIQRNAPEATYARKLVGTWCISRKDPNSINNVIHTLMQMQPAIKEALPLVTRELKNKGNAPHLRAMTVALAAKLNGKDSVKDLEELLGDATLIATPQVRVGMKPVSVPCQLGDIALGMLVLLNNQNPRDYGFDFFESNPNFRIDLKAIQYVPYHQLGFSTKEKRDKALAKWREAVKK